MDHLNIDISQYLAMVEDYRGVEGAFEKQQPYPAFEATGEAVQAARWTRSPTGWRCRGSPPSFPSTRRYSFALVNLALLVLGLWLLIDALAVSGRSPTAQAVGAALYTFALPVVVFASSLFIDAGVVGVLMIGYWLMARRWWWALVLFFPVSYLVKESILVLAPAAIWAWSTSGHRYKDPRFVVGAAARRARRRSPPRGGSEPLHPNPSTPSPCCRHGSTLRWNLTNLTSAVFFVVGMATVVVPAVARHPPPVVRPRTQSGPEHHLGTRPRRVRGGRGLMNVYSLVSTDLTLRTGWLIWPFAIGLGAVWVDQRLRSFPDRLDKLIGHEADALGRSRPETLSPRSAASWVRLDLGMIVARISPTSSFVSVRSGAQKRTRYASDRHRLTQRRRERNTLNSSTLWTSSPPAARIVVADTTPRAPRLPRRTPRRCRWRETDSPARPARRRSEGSTDARGRSRATPRAPRCRTRPTPQDRSRRRRPPRLRRPRRRHLVPGCRPASSSPRNASGPTPAAREDQLQELHGFSGLTLRRARPRRTRAHPVEHATQPRGSARRRRTSSPGPKTRPTSKSRTPLVRRSCVVGDRGQEAGPQRGAQHRLLRGKWVGDAQTVALQSAALQIARGQERHRHRLREPGSDERPARTTSPALHGRPSKLALRRRRHRPGDAGHPVHPTDLLDHVDLGASSRSARTGSSTSRSPADASPAGTDEKPIGSIRVRDLRRDRARCRGPG